VRERVSDIAVLKTLGFRDGTICALIVGEAMMLLVLGGMLGLALAAAGLPALSRALRGQLPPLSVGLDTWLIGLAIMIVLGLVVGLPPALGALRLKIVDALARA
jgi:putative ABC transport system permease protein